MVPEGYGIAYSIKNGSVHYNITSLKRGPGSWDGKQGIDQACAKMAHALAEALDEMEVIFGTGAQIKAKL